MKMATGLIRRHVDVLLLYGVVGTLLYAPTLGTFFTSDDFEFLNLVAPARSLSVAFEPVSGRYVRPLVVLMYYANYHAFGLSPWGYHLAALASHVMSSWLVCLVALQLDPEAGRLRPAVAGLTFLVFSGHSEAVGWAAGIADPLLTVCLLTAFLLYLRAVVPGASRGWAVASVATMAAGALAKELWVVYPAVLVAHLAVFGRARTAGWRRAIVLIGISVLAVAGYLAMRRSLFGSVAGGYEGLGTSFNRRMAFDQARAFVLRCFVPAGLPLAKVWLRRTDLIVWPLIALALSWSARGLARRVMLFAALATVVSLLPVLPLTISLATTESERLVYLPTVFSTILLTTAIFALIRPRAVALALCGALMVWHTAVLWQDNLRWRAAGSLARRVADSFADQVRRHATGDHWPIFLLNLPDNLQGAYVFRNGLSAAVRLLAPDVADSTERVVVVASVSLDGPFDRARVTPSGTDRFAVDLGRARIIQPRVPASTWYGIADQTPGAYQIAFVQTVGTGHLFYTSGGRLEYRSVHGRGLPFGTVEMPRDGATCEGMSIRFSGWALGEAVVTRVALTALDERGSAAMRPMGDATWAVGTRPDVATLYGWLPQRDRAEWDFYVPCRVVAAAPQGELRVRVTAVDDAGQETVLGVRALRTGS